MENLLDMISFPPSKRVLRDDDVILCSGHDIKNAVLKMEKLVSENYNPDISLKEIERFKEMYMENEYPLANGALYYIYWGGDMMNTLLCKRFVKESA